MGANPVGRVAKGLARRGRSGEARNKTRVRRRRRGAAGHARPGGHQTELDELVARRVTSRWGRQRPASRPGSRNLTHADDLIAYATISPSPTQWRVRSRTPCPCSGEYRAARGRRLGSRPRVWMPPQRGPRLRSGVTYAKMSGNAPRIIRVSGVRVPPPASTAHGSATSPAASRSPTAPAGATASSST
jgi:hypothetical protein